MRQLTVSVAAAAVLLAGAATMPAGADPDTGHQVTYTVTTTSDLTANIYYVMADPPGADQANDAQFMPLVSTVTQFPRGVRHVIPPPVGLGCRSTGWHWRCLAAG